MRPSPPPSASSWTAPERAARLEALCVEARGCTRCPQLVASRTAVVVGDGAPNADVLFVGEAPGPNEDAQGLPLAGAPGRLLAALLAEVGLRRDAVHVTTVVKCRPPSNRDPLAEELANCRTWLDAQVEVIRPKVVCPLGTVPTKLLRRDPVGIRAVRGRVEVVTIGRLAVRVLPLLHPVAALYQDELAETLRADLALLPGLLALSAPPQPAPQPPGPARPGPGRADPGPDAGGPGEQLGLF